MNLVLVENVLGVVVTREDEDEPVMGLSVTMELLLTELLVVTELGSGVGVMYVEVREAVMGSSVLPLLVELEEEVRVLVKVPVVLRVLVMTVVLSGTELVKGV